jgi:hypothetical protein
VVSGEAGLVLQMIDLFSKSLVEKEEYDLGEIVAFISFNDLKSKRLLSYGEIRLSYQ